MCSLSSLFPDALALPFASLAFSLRPPLCQFEPGNCKSYSDDLEELQPSYKLEGPSDDTLVFDSRFESGNLEEARRMYDLVLHCCASRSTVRLCVHAYSRRCAWEARAFAGTQRTPAPGVASTTPPCIGGARLFG